MASVERARSLRRRGLVLGVVGCWASAWAALCAAGDETAKKLQKDGRETATRPAVDFEKEVKPVVESFCLKCHGGGGKKPKGDVDLSSAKEASCVEKDRKLWAVVLDRLEARDMPPEGKPRPTEKQYDKVVLWLKSRLNQTGCNGLIDPGRVTLRRLNRNEYNNTIRDLVGLDLRPADDFPSDDVGYGFDNIGDVLSLPPILMERYLTAAEKVAEAAIVVDRHAEITTERRQAIELGDDAGGSRFEERGRILSSNGEIGFTHVLPKNAAYLFKARVFGQQAGSEPVRMALKLDGKPLRVVEVRSRQDSPATFAVKIKAHAGPRRFSVAFLNDYYNEKDPNPKNRDRNLIVESFEIRGPLDQPPPPLPASHARILFKTPASGSRRDREACARAVLKRFADRAFRRPASNEEIDRLLVVFNEAERNGEKFERSIQLGIEAILVSPYFLYKVEVDRARPTLLKPGVVAVRPLSDYELASRLSYFLWSSMPDDELFELARKKALNKDEVLEAQTKRMLKDPKARALAENFGDQWLQIRNLKIVNPDRERFPNFDAKLRADMARETETFFRAIVDEDRSVLDFLDADYAFVNERLARHYGLSGVQGEAFRRVKLTDGRRGGVLTQASVLTVTSNPTRTSPVKRGRWVLEQLLGTPPPPPPPNVPELKDDKNAELKGSLRQRMEQHRADPNCASCHARMDPLGFGLENYDAVGAWREKDGGFPIDSSGTLPNGASFQGPTDLKKILKGRSRDFARCLTEKMLIYALGRGLESRDRCVLDAIVEELPRRDYRFSALATAIVKSQPFRNRSVERTLE